MQEEEIEKELYLGTENAPDERMRTFDVSALLDDSVSGDMKQAGK